mgnify:CR=1 FL=1
MRLKEGKEVLDILVKNDYEEPRMIDLKLEVSTALADKL